MSKRHIDWERLIENTEFDHVAWRDMHRASFYEREVFLMRVDEHDEERAESIAPEGIAAAS